MPKTDEKLKAKCIDLRVNKRMSQTEIRKELHLSKGTIYEWLKPYPLTKEEIYERQQNRDRHKPLKDRRPESSMHKAIPASQMSPAQKGKVAEAAAMLRLQVHGIPAYKSPFDGDRIDLVILGQDGKAKKCQVKWAKSARTGLPSVPIRCADGRSRLRRYKDDEFDFLLGYHYFSDTMYVWSMDELKNQKQTITVTENAAERFDKIKSDRGFESRTDR